MTSLSPIFFIGFPRSGTTVAFEGFCRHPMLGWPSTYTEAYPATPAAEMLRRLLDNSIVRLAGKKGQYGKTVPGNRFLPQPSEAYSFWDLHAGTDFARGFLADRNADDETVTRVRTAVQRLLKWQGRSRFAAKLTGPPRILFLDRIFPGCQFVHIVRDGRAAVHSVLRVPFWREKGGFDGPFWRGVLSEQQERDWQACGRDPGVLAALQWSSIVESSRTEGSSVGPGRYRELRYEDFVRAPHTILRELYEFCGLTDAPEGHAYLDRNATLEDMNRKYRHDFSASYIDQLSSVMQSTLASFDYPV